MSEIVLYYSRRCQYCSHVLKVLDDADTAYHRVCVDDLDPSRIPNHVDRVPLMNVGVTTYVDEALLKYLEANVVNAPPKKSPQAAVTDFEPMSVSGSMSYTPMNVDTRVDKPAETTDIERLMSMRSKDMADIFGNTPAPPPGGLTRAMT